MRGERRNRFMAFKDLPLRSNLNISRILPIALVAFLLTPALAAPTPPAVPELQKLQDDASSGNTEAMNKLAYRYFIGAGFAQDSSKAFELFRKSAEAGYAPAMINAARCYRDGDGVPKNEQRAREWMQRALAVTENAANKGDTISMFMLGSIYEFGVAEITVDKARSRDWLKKGAQAGDPQAMRALALSLLEENNPDTKTAFGWALKAAKAGDLMAMTLVSQMSADGQGVARDEKQSRAWLQKAADGGQATAMRLLAERYYRGQDIAADQTQAKRWMEKAAAAGDTKAMNDLGNRFANGDGVNKDEKTAASYWAAAAYDGDAPGMFSFALALLNGRGVEKDEELAAMWYERAADEGNIPAMNNLGLLYMNGRGVERDPGKGTSLFRKAAEAGNRDAMRNLSKAYREGAGVTADSTLADEWQRKADAAH